MSPLVTEKPSDRTLWVSCVLNAILEVRRTIYQARSEARGEDLDPSQASNNITNPYNLRTSDAIPNSRLDRSRLFGSVWLVKTNCLPQSPKVLNHSLQSFSEWSRHGGVLYCPPYVGAGIVFQTLSAISYRRSTLYAHHLTTIAQLPSVTMHPSIFDSIWHAYHTYIHRFSNSQR